MNEINDFHLKCENIAKTKFGYSKIKCHQQQIIDKIYVKKDVLGIVATGGGKSLCYQIFYYLFDNSILVISPLIALIQDQIDSLHKKKYSSSCFNWSY